jgi:hypothetical protein
MNERVQRCGDRILVDKSHNPRILGFIYRSCRAPKGHVGDHEVVYLGEVITRERGRES